METMSMVGVFILEVSVEGEDFVFVAGVERVHEVEVAFDEFQEDGLAVDDEGDGDGVEMG